MATGKDKPNQSQSTPPPIDDPLIAERKARLEREKYAEEYKARVEGEVYKDFFAGVKTTRENLTELAAKAEEVVRKTIPTVVRAQQAKYRSEMGDYGIDSMTLTCYDMEFVIGKDSDANINRLIEVAMNGFTADERKHVAHAAKQIKNGARELFMQMKETLTEFPPPKPHIAEKLAADKIKELEEEDPKRKIGEQLHLLWQARKVEEEAEQQIRSREKQKARHAKIAEKEGLSPEEIKLREEQALKDKIADSAADRLNEFKTAKSAADSDTYVEDFDLSNTELAKKVTSPSVLVNTRQHLNVWTLIPGVEANAETIERLLTKSGYKRKNVKEKTKRAKTKMDRVDESAFRKTSGKKPSDLN